MDTQMLDLTLKEKGSFFCSSEVAGRDGFLNIIRIIFFLRTTIMQTTQTGTRRPKAQQELPPYMLADDLPNLRASLKQGTSNPLADILTDETYLLLRSNDLLNEKSLRDFIIRQMFLRLKSDGAMKTHEAIKSLTDMYPYLQFDTIRKIVYRVYPSSSRKSMM
jgi:hypothetical protein